MADVETAKDAGNSCMAVGDFVNAMKWYSQALTVAPRDAALYSNRSFAFLKLGLPERALADADEAIRRRPDWAKAHFRRAEALSRAHVHTDALRAYAEGARLDASDTHLQSQCAEAKARLAAQRRSERLQVAACALIGLLVLGLLLLAPAAPAAAGPGGAGGAGGGAGAAGYLLRGFGAMLGAALGGAGGAGAVALRHHLRRSGLGLGSQDLPALALILTFTPTLALTLTLALNPALPLALTTCAGAQRCRHCRATSTSPHCRCVATLAALGHFAPRRLTLTLELELTAQPSVWLPHCPTVDLSYQLLAMLQGARAAGCGGCARDRSGGSDRGSR